MRTIEQKAKMAEAMRKYRATHPGRARATQLRCIAAAPDKHIAGARRRSIKYVYKNSYGLSLEDVEDMKRAQNNKCAVCDTEFTTDKKFTCACVDHDHATGKVRDILCKHCNTALGHMKDDPDKCLRLATYVKQWRAA